MTEPTSLQEKWDRHLIKSWFEYPDNALGHMVAAFTQKEKTDPIQAGLLRVPERFHLRRSVRGWVCTYIPKLGEALWATDPDDVLRRTKIVNILKTSKMDKLADNQIRGRAPSELRKLKKDIRVSQFGHKRGCAVHMNTLEKTAKSNWSQCK